MNAIRALCTKVKAEALAKRFKQVNANIRVYLFGSVARDRIGRDLDFILEVTDAVFQDYADRCLDSLGVHWAVNRLVDPGDYFWTYYAPNAVRSEAAFAALGAKSDTAFLEASAAAGVPVDQLDIICLPEGWNVPESTVQMLLSAALNADDPQFLENVIRDAEELAPPE